MRTIRSVTTAALVGAGLISSCGKEEKIKFPGNADLLFELKEDRPIEGLDMTIKRIRAWRSAANNEKPGVVNLVDRYTIELWYVLAGEEEERYSSLNNFLADEDLNLHDETSNPGQKFFHIASNRASSEEPFTYTVTKENGLIAEEFPATSSWEEVTTAEGVTTSTTQLVKAHDLTDAGWSKIRRRSVANGLITSRQRFVENTNYETKAKLACLVKTPNESSELLPKSFLYGDVELGSTFQDKSGQYISGTPAGLGDDDALLIPWTEYWLLTGGSFRDRKFRFIRVRGAPFFNGRELPGVDISDTKPKISGMENLIRTCNGAAARSGGYFSMVSLAGSPLAPILSIGTSSVFCSSMVSTLATNADSLRLDTFFPCVFTGLGNTAAGTWNGTAHGGPVTSAGSNLNHIEQTEIKEIQF
jgi:hypothetical protein